MNRYRIIRYGDVFLLEKTAGSGSISYVDKRQHEWFSLFNAINCANYASAEEAEHYIPEVVKQFVSI